MLKNSPVVQHVSELSQDTDIGFDDSDDQLSYLKRYVKGQQFGSLRENLIRS